MQTVETLNLLISKDISMDLHFYINLFKHFKARILVEQNTYNILFTKKV